MTREAALEAELLEAMAIAAEARARRSGRSHAARSALATAEALRRRAGELRALSRARPPLAVVRPSPGERGSR